MPLVVERKHDSRLMIFDRITGKQIWIDFRMRSEYRCLVRIDADSQFLVLREELVDGNERDSDFEIQIEKGWRDSEP